LSGVKAASGSGVFVGQPPPHQLWNLGIVVSSGRLIIFCILGAQDDFYTGLFPSSLWMRRVRRRGRHWAWLENLNVIDQFCTQFTPKSGGLFPRIQNWGCRSPIPPSSDAYETALHQPAYTEKPDTGREACSQLSMYITTAAGICVIWNFCDIKIIVPTCIINKTPRTCFALDAFVADHPMHISNWALQKNQLTTILLTVGMARREPLGPRRAGPSITFCCVMRSLQQPRSRHSWPHENEARWPDDTCNMAIFG